MVERFNRTLEDQLATFVDYIKETGMSISYISYGVLFCHTRVHGLYSCKSYLWRDLWLPVDLLSGRPEEEALSSAVDYTGDICEKLKWVHHSARNHLKMASDRMKQRYDLLQSGSSRLAGDTVWFHTPQRKKGLSRKL